MLRKIEEVLQREIEAFARIVECYERAAKRDVAVRAAGAFVIYSRKGALDYAPGREVPEGASIIARWVKKKKRWVLCA